jgi:hemolysin activation/secretion protein
VVVLGANSFTALGEKTEATFLSAFDGTQIYGQLASELFLGGSGLKLRVYGGSGFTSPSGALAAIGYRGYTTAVGLGLTYPLIRRRQETLDLGVNFDVLQSNIHIGSNPSLLFSQDNLRVLRLGGHYARSDLWLGDDRTAVSILGFQVSHGLNIFDGSRNGDPLAARLNERTDFTKITFEASRTQTLFQPWSGASLAVEGRIAGQFTGDVLPPAEQFFLGGSRWTRGYYAGQVTGDRALVATVEPQLNTKLNVHLFDQAFDLGVQFYLFYDWGQTWQNQSIDTGAIVTSLGGGLRLAIDQTTELGVEVVARGNLRPQGGGANVSPLTEHAVYWRLMRRF